MFSIPQRLTPSSGAKLCCVRGTGLAFSSARFRRVSRHDFVFLTSGLILYQLKNAIARSVKRGFCWASDALLLHTSISSSGMHRHQRDSSTSVDVAVMCAQTRSRLSLARLLLPLPQALGHHHHEHHHEQHHQYRHHHQQDPFDSIEADSPSSFEEKKFSTTALLLTAATLDCPLHIASSSGSRFKNLYFAWLGDASQKSSAVFIPRAPERLPSDGKSAVTAPSSSPPSIPSGPLRPITLHRMTSVLTSTSLPHFYPICNTLKLPSYPLHRHITLFPPCAEAQARPPPNLSHSQRFSVRFYYFLMFPFNRLIAACLKVGALRSSCFSPTS
jgi:hypothetical protein